MELDDDEAALRRNPVLASLSAERFARVKSYVTVERFPAAAHVVSEGDGGRDLYFVLEGTAALRRRHVELRALEAGDHFGELALIARRPRAASVIARSALVLAKLSAERYQALAREDPGLALELTQAFVARLGEQLTEMTDNVGALLKERSLPRRTHVEVQLPEGVRCVQTGTTLAELLPPFVGEKLVVAGLLDHKPVSLTTPLSSDARLEPLTVDHLEGEKVHRASLGLLLLEAAERVDPSVSVRMGPSLGFAQEIWVELAGEARARFARLLEDAMKEIAAEDAALRQEWWTVEEATSYFVERGFDSAVRLLRTWRDATAPMVSYGRVYALSKAPLVPRSGLLRGFSIVPRADVLLLEPGDGSTSQPQAIELHDVRARDGSTMVREHRHWLAALGVTSVGAFNDCCVSGQVSQLIRVAEGFHEKRIGQIADAIVGRERAVRVIGMAGPSSSGKTTFIRRLMVQLQINGLRPLSIGLDDYYVDRDKTVRDASGDYDYEAFDAIDHRLLRAHLARLLAGERVKTARYDFDTGKSQPDGGEAIELGDGDVLLLEGIHGLNPRLFEGWIDPALVFRIFVNPMTALPLDQLSHVSVSDLRLLRRIVRDRFQRGASAADNIQRWPSVRRGERSHIFPYLGEADAIFDSALVYEPSVLKVYAERYLLEVPQRHPSYTTAFRLRQLIDRFVTIYPDHVPSTSILREFIGGSGFGA